MSEQKHTPTPWAQGRMLETTRTASFAQEERERIQKLEARTLFANFHPSDEGKSRRVIARFETPEDAKIALCAVNNHARLVEALERITETGSDNEFKLTIAIEEARALLSELKEAK